MTLADMLLGRPVTLPDGRTVDLRQRAYNAKSTALHRDEINARKRARYAAKREEISEKRRAQYAADAGWRRRSHRGPRGARARDLGPHAAAGHGHDRAEDGRSGSQAHQGRG